MTIHHATAYAETAALVAVMNGQPDEARRIVNDMYPAERETFADQLTALRNMLGQYCQVCGDPTPAALTADQQQYLCRDCAHAAQGLEG